MNAVNIINPFRHTSISCYMNDGVLEELNAIEGFFYYKRSRDMQGIHCMIQRPTGDPENHPYGSAQFFGKKTSEGYTIYAAIRISAQVRTSGNGGENAMLRYPHRKCLILDKYTIAHWLCLSFGIGEQARLLPLAGALSAAQSLGMQRHARARNGAYK